MEKQIKHRILGVLVILGLVVILLPLFQSNGDLTPNTALVKAPPFPDQPVQVSADDSQSLTSPSQHSNSPHPDDDIISVVHPSIVNNTSLDASSNNEVKNDTIQIPLSHSEIAQSEMSMNKEVTSKEKQLDQYDPDVEKTSKYRIIETDSIATLRERTPRNSKSEHFQKPTIDKAVITKQKKDVDSLTKLTNAAWVIQVGSYKNKTNALRIVNQLRANGYRAFIQEISTSFGDHTRVYIGPENKRADASALASRLKSNMHIQGIVISYQPLTL